MKCWIPTPFPLHVAPPKHIQKHNPEVVHWMLSDPTNLYVAFCTVIQFQKAKQDPVFLKDMG